MARMDKGELAEVGKWKDKALSSKGGIVNHVFRNDKAIRKTCGCVMGVKCDHPYIPWTNKKDD